MRGFPGFPEGKLRVTPVPNLFFSDLLPAIDHLGELKVTLYSFWALAQLDTPVRYLRLTDFTNDVILMDGLAATPTLAMETLLEGLERAVARGTFLHLSVESADGRTDLYFLNTPKGRAAVQNIERGEWRPGLGREPGASLLVERPNIFVLYEQNIGALTPMMADTLREAEKSYPAEWINEAIEIAVHNNVRRWRYVQAILEGWRQNGKERGKSR
jgi:DnaD/phage-associated family protein